MRIRVRTGQCRHPGFNRDELEPQTHCCPSGPADPLRFSGTPLGAEQPKLAEWRERGW